MPKINNIKWRKQHTDVLKRYYQFKSSFPFAPEHHFTITPVGEKISKQALISRFKNLRSQCPSILAVLYNYEVSDSGVHHIHGIMLATSGVAEFAKSNQLVFLSSKGGRNGWIKYMCKDKGKTYSACLTQTIIQNYK